MIPRIKVGKGVTGAVRYVLSEGKDRTGHYRTEPKGEASRVGWISGLNLGFEIETAADADLARRVMEFDAANQNSRTRTCEKDCVHLSLGWRKGEQPTREQMEQAAHAALAALGMGNAKAIIVAHTDEPYVHLHIVASKIDPATGRAYDLKGDRLKLSAWAQGYEEEHNGGIVCIRRAEANQLRAAIEARDATAVLALMTQQRATFKPADLERALAKQIKQPLERAQFGDEVLALPDVVRLAEKPGDPVTRYTTRAILQAEGQVTLAARALNQRLDHRVPWVTLTRIAEQPEFRTMTREQRTAFAQATQARGLALIDGQAGTGKSYTMAAIRQAYEANGYAAIGLAPTNAVAQDMRAGGFSHADTIHAELFRLNNNRTSPWTGRTVLMVDEAAMIDTRLMAQLMRRAEEAGAKMILVGDDRQLSSIDRGGMFGALKDEFGAATLSEVRRQHKQDDRRAAELMAEGNFSAALAIYEDKGAIRWQHNQESAREALVERWTKDSAADPSRSRFVFAYTNDDVDQLNAAVRQVREERGELGEGHRFATKHGPADFATGDRIQLTGTASKRAGLVNGAAGTIKRIHGSTIAVQLDGSDGRTLSFDAGQFQDFRHGYAGTIYKGQGRTLDQTYLYHSEHWRASSGYVAMTRHKDKTEIFVARDVVEDLPQLARQMGRVDDRRAASHFHQPDGALAIERMPTAELPVITLPGRQDGRGASETGPTPLAQPHEQAANENRKLRPTPEPARESRLMLEGPTDDELNRQPGREADYLDHLESRHERADAMLTEQRRAQALDDRAKAFQVGKEHEAEEGRRKQGEQDAAEAREGRNGDISSAAARYSIAIGQTYDVRDPYASLGRAAGSEAAMFHRSQEEHRAAAAKETDPDKRTAIELRRRIEGCDYMAITSERLAGISETVTGRVDNEYAVKDRQQAAHYRAMAAGLREERGTLLEAAQGKGVTVEVAQDQVTEQAKRQGALEPRARGDSRPAYRNEMPATAPTQESATPTPLRVAIEPEPPKAPAAPVPAPEQEIKPAAPATVSVTPPRLAEYSASAWFGAISYKPTLVTMPNTPAPSQDVAAPAASSGVEAQQASPDLPKAALAAEAAPAPPKLITRRFVEATAADHAAAKAAGIETRQVSTPTTEATHSQGVTRTVEITDSKAVASGVRQGAVRKVTGNAQEREPGHDPGRGRSR